MMDGRVKTLHPRVHGGLLARRDVPAHMAAGRGARHRHDRPGVREPLRVRGDRRQARASPRTRRSRTSTSAARRCCARAAKNFASVTVVTEPGDYDAILAEMRANGGATTLETRTRARDRGLPHHERLRQRDLAVPLAATRRRAFPDEVRLPPREGAGPALRREPAPAGGVLPLRRRQASTRWRAPSSSRARSSRYNNILDTDACWTAVREFDEPACVIVKHTNPCGVCDRRRHHRRRTSRRTTPTRSRRYGGVMAFNRTVPASLIEAHQRQQAVRRGHDRARLRARRARAARGQARTCACCATGGVRPTGGHYEVARVEGGMLIQTSDTVAEDPADVHASSRSASPPPRRWSSCSSRGRSPRPSRATPSCSRRTS